MYLNCKPQKSTSREFQIRRVIQSHKEELKKSQKQKINYHLNLFQKNLSYLRNAKAHLDYKIKIKQRQLPKRKLFLNPYNTSLIQYF